MTCSDLIHALEARRSGASWLARCPAHDDSTPSLSIREVEGKVLLHCHAGCAQSDVISALKSRGLWQPARKDHPPQGKSGEFECAYDYTDEAGELLYQIVRKKNPKGFSQRYPDGRGGWVWRKHPRQVLYHLPEVLEAPIIFYVEGERDTETLRSWGFVATTAAGGVNQPWLPEFTEFLHDREVIILPDNDAPGRQRALSVARALLGKVAKLTILQLEGAKDVTEWFGQGHRELELIAQLESEAVSQ